MCPIQFQSFQVSARLISNVIVQFSCYLLWSKYGLACLYNCSARTNSQIRCIWTHVHEEKFLVLGTHAKNLFWGFSLPVYVGLYVRPRTQFVSKKQWQISHWISSSFQHYTASHDCKWISYNNASWFAAHDDSNGLNWTCAGNFANRWYKCNNTRTTCIGNVWSLSYLLMVAE
jgi:hypothetical protein